MTAGEGNEMDGDPSRTHTHIHPTTATHPPVTLFLRISLQKIRLWRITEPKVYVARSSSAYELGKCGPEASVHPRLRNSYGRVQLHRESPLTKEMKRSGDGETSPPTGSVFVFQTLQTRGVRNWNRRGRTDQTTNTMEVTQRVGLDARCPLLFWFRCRRGEVSQRSELTQQSL